jgi:hypothetical protein
MSLTPWATMADVYFCKISGGRADHIFLQNRDKKYKKNSIVQR